ncbi:unnamed protein product, partial [Prunus brigantina]
ADKGEFCTLEIHHGGVVQDGVYKGGTLCYLDNCMDAYLSLLDLRKIGIALEYEVDLTKKEIGLQIYCMIYDSNGETIVKLIDKDSVICDMSEEYNYERFNEDQMKEVNEALDADEHVVSLGDCEAAVDEEEEESEFVDSDYEFSEDEEANKGCNVDINMPCDEEVNVETETQGP